jgi:hypothetical protein
MCNACRKQFTVTVGTLFERSHIPLNKWLLALYLLMSSKKGMSTHQMHACSLRLRRRPMLRAGLRYHMNGSPEAIPRVGDELDFRRRVRFL